MGIVTNVKWTCPGCGTDNIAQIYDWWHPRDYYEEEPPPLPHKAVPLQGASLKWNPPCTKCGKYKLTEPDYLVELPIVRVEED